MGVSAAGAMAWQLTFAGYAQVARHGTDLPDGASPHDKNISLYPK
jgi:hypothetical protein